MSLSSLVSAVQTAVDMADAAAVAASDGLAAAKLAGVQAKAALEMSDAAAASAVQTAVDMSDAAADAAAEALAAAKLAGLQAKVALAAVHVALEIDANIKSDRVNNNDGNVPTANIETKPRPDLKIININGVDSTVEEGENTIFNSDEDADDALLASTAAHSPEPSDLKSVSRKNKRVRIRKERYCENCHLDSRYACLHGKHLLKVLEKSKGMKMKACGKFWPPEKLGKIGEVVGGDNHSVQIMWDGTSARGDSGHVVSYSLLVRGEYVFKFWCQESSEAAMSSARGQEICLGQMWLRQGGVI